MPTLNEVKTNLVNEFYQQNFMSTQEAAAWINSFLDKNCKESFDKAKEYDDLSERLTSFYSKPEKQFLHIKVLDKNIVIHKSEGICQ